MSRRESQERVAYVAEIEISRAQTEAAAAQAELLAGRNHLARELHDVLAHTLSALSIQLEAFDAVLDRDATSSEALGQLESAKRLVRDGLAEARGAVVALREDAAPVAEQLASLATSRGMACTVSGQPRPVSPEVGLTLYRVAQEAITNAMKHAPEMLADVSVDFREDRVVLEVHNQESGDGATSVLGSTGAGYGLRGMEERVRLVDGTLVAGPMADGWTVRAEVPI